MTTQSLDSIWRVQLELTLTAPQDLDLGTWIPMLHRIIQQRELDETWIDVVDYRHVGDGPALLLVAHDAYYGVEHNGQRSALLYRRRRPAAGTLGERLSDGARRLSAFAERLAAEPVTDDVSWRTDRWTVTLMDRLLASADEATFDAFVHSLYGMERQLWGDGVVERRMEAASQGPFTVHLVGDSQPDPGVLRRRLTAGPPQAQDAAVSVSPSAAHLSTSDVRAAGVTP